jgi:hypothetical protein
MATPNLDVLEQIAAALRASGFPAWKEHHTVAIAAHGSRAWIIGNSNDTWSADLVYEAGNYADVTLVSEEPSSSRDAAKIATALASLIEGEN